MEKEIRIYGVSFLDYNKDMSDDEFMTIAENDGYVWSQKGFNELDKPIIDLVLRVFYV